MVVPPFLNATVDGSVVAVNVRELDAVRVFPSAIVSVEEVVGGVIVTLLSELTVVAPALRVPESAREVVEIPPEAVVRPVTPRVPVSVMDDAVIAAPAKFPEPSRFTRVLAVAAFVALVFVQLPAVAVPVQVRTSFAVRAAVTVGL